MTVTLKPITNINDVKDHIADSGFNFFNWTRQGKSLSEVRKIAEEAFEKADAVGRKNIIANLGQAYNGKSAFYAQINNDYSLRGWFEWIFKKFTLSNALETSEKFLLAEAMKGREVEDADVIQGQEMGDNFIRQNFSLIVSFAEQEFTKKGTTLTEQCHILLYLERCITVMQQELGSSAELDDTMIKAKQLCEDFQIRIHLKNVIQSAYSLNLTPDNYSRIFNIAKEEFNNASLEERLHILIHLQFFLTTHPAKEKCPESLKAIYRNLQNQLIQNSQPADLRKAIDYLRIFLPSIFPTRIPIGMAYPSEQTRQIFNGGRIAPDNYIFPLEKPSKQIEIETCISLIANVLEKAQSALPSPLPALEFLPISPEISKMATSRIQFFSREECAMIDHALQGNADLLSSCPMEKWREADNRKKRQIEFVKDDARFNQLLAIALKQANKPTMSLEKLKILSTNLCRAISLREDRTEQVLEVAQRLQKTIDQTAQIHFLARV